MSPWPGLDFLIPSIQFVYFDANHLPSDQNNIFFRYLFIEIHPHATKLELILSLGSDIAYLIPGLTLGKTIFVHFLVPGEHTATAFLQAFQEYNHVHSCFREPGQQQ